eukprot:TRINITY_DN8189_c0_g1_i3.p1 TRINITY_DN8189_c0_g1~~TRINITY_DN8189_c0_g1_i3.p1  ORF type:complete len:4463 (+),score=588.39 TRINITY_DN8189_c0_g1_i3:111-13499(+)
MAGTEQYAPGTDDVFYILSVLMLGFSIGWYLMYSHIVLAWVTCKLLERFALREEMGKKTEMLSIKGITLSPLSGRIVMTDVKYFSRDMSCTVSDGRISIWWWGRHYRGNGKPKVKVHLNGLELTIYNSHSKYKDFRAQFDARGLDSDGDVNYQGLQEDVSTKRTRRPPSESPPTAVDSEGRTLTRNPPPGVYQRLMQFLGRVSIDVREGNMAIGTPHAKKCPFFLNVTFGRLSGFQHCDQSFHNPNDLYRIVCDSTFHDVSIRLIKCDKLTTNSQSVTRSTVPDNGNLSHFQESESSTDEKSDAVGSEPQKGETIKIRLKKRAKWVAKELRIAFYGDAEPIHPDESLFANETKHVDSEDLCENYGVIIDSKQKAAIRLFYYQDVPGVELDEKRPRSADDLPKTGIHVDIFASDLCYGPFVNLIRAKIQSIFLPWDYRTWGPYIPRNSDWREYGGYEQVITFKCPCTISIPWRQKTESISPPLGLEYSGISEKLEIKVGEGSRYVYKYPYPHFSETDRVVTETLFELNNCKLWSSLTKTEIFTAEQVSINMDLQYASQYVFNRSQNWDTIINIKNGKLLFLQDLSKYFADLMTDFSYPWVMYLSEPLTANWSGSLDYFILEYAPYHQRYELFIEGLDVQLYANDNNVIYDLDPSANTMVTFRIGEASIEYTSGNDVFTIAQENVINSEFNINIAPLEVLLHLPEKHEAYKYHKNICECFLVLEEIGITGSSASSWPNTDQAQGNPSWVPERDPPKSWKKSVPRSPLNDTSHSLVDLVITDVQVNAVTMVMYGWHAKCLSNLAANYGGASSSFVNPQCYSGFVSPDYPDGRNAKSDFFTFLSTRKQKQWRSADASTSINITSCQFYFPLVAPSSPEPGVSSDNSQPSNIIFAADVLSKGGSFYIDKDKDPTVKLEKEQPLLVLRVENDWASCTFGKTLGWCKLSEIVPYTAGAIRNGNGLQYRVKAREYGPEERWGDLVDIVTHEINVEANASQSYSDTSITISPLTMRCPLTPESDGRSLNFELFAGIDGIQINTASSYGPAPDLLNYANRIRCSIGNVTSHLLISQVVLITELVDQMSKQLLFVDKTLKDKIVAARSKLPPVTEPSQSTCNTVTCSHLWTNEALVSEFKNWLNKKELGQKEASQMAYNSMSLMVDSMEANTKLDYGYVSVLLPKGLTVTSNTLDDRNTCRRGTLLIPVFHIRLLYEKYGELLRHMEGDHSEVGSITSAVSIRYSEAKRGSGGDNVGNTAQRNFLQKFDLTHCGIKSFVENSENFTANHFPGGERRLSRKQRPSLHRNTSIRSAATSSHNPPATSSTSYNQASDQNSLSLDLSPSTIGHRQDDPASFVSTLPGLNVAEIEDFQTEPNTQEYKDPELNNDNPIGSPSTPPLVDEDIDTFTSKENIPLVTNNDDDEGDLMSCAVPVFEGSSSASTPPLESEGEHSENENPLLRLNRRVSDASPGDMLQTCVSGEWSDIEGSDGGFSSRGSKRVLSRSHSALSARSLHSFRSSKTGSFRTIPGATPIVARSRSFGSTPPIQPPPLGGWGRSKTSHLEPDEDKEEKDEPFPQSHSYPVPKQRSLEFNRPPGLDRRRIVTTDMVSESSDSDEDKQCDDDALGRTGKQQLRELDEDGGCQLSEYAMCLKSSKLIVPRASKDTALMYGKGRFRGASNYAYAPHPRVYFEERGRKTALNTLFLTTEEQSAHYRKQLTQPPQFFDTNENQREHTSTHTTHLSFLQPLHALFTQKAACLLIHGHALYNLWRTDLHARHGIKKDEPEEVKLKKQQSDLRPRKKRGLSLRKSDRFKKAVIDCRTQKILSIQIPEVVCVYVLALKTTDSTEQSTPCQIKTVVQDSQLLYSVRSAGNYMRTTGRQPSTTISAKLGAAATIFQSAQGNRARRSSEMPTLVPADMRPLLLSPEHRLIGECILRSTSDVGSSFIFRAKQEVTPSPSATQDASLQKYVLQIGDINVAFGPDILYLMGVSEQIKWIGTLWGESKKESPTSLDVHEMESDIAEVLHQSGGTLPLDQQSRDASFVMIDDVSVDGLVPHSFQYQRSHFHAIRKTLFGAAESVVEALNRRRSRKVHETSGSAFCCTSAQEPPTVSYNDDGHVAPQTTTSVASSRHVVIPVEEAEPAEMPILGSSPKSPQRGNPLDPDIGLGGETATQPAQTPHVSNLADETQHTTTTQSVEPPTSPFLSWLSDAVAVHIMTSLDKLHVKSYPQLNRDSVSEFTVFNTSARLLCNNDSAREKNPTDPAWHKKLETPRESPGITRVIVPITCVLKVAKISSKLQAPLMVVIKNFNRDRPPSPFTPDMPVDAHDDAMSACSIPVTMSTTRVQCPLQKQTGKILIPFVYCSAVVTEVDVWVMYNTSNYVDCSLKSLSAMATNRAANDSIHPIVRNDDRGKVPTSTTSIQKSHRPRPSDEQLHHREKSDGSLLHSPRSRSGSITTHHSARKKSFAGFPSTASVQADPILSCPGWVFSLSLDKRNVTNSKDSITICYNCRPLREGEVEEKPTEIVSTRVKSFHASVIVPTTTSSASPAACHVFVDGVSSKVTSHEWYHTDHCLREWEKLVLRWESSMVSPLPTRQYPRDIGSPHIVSPGSDVPYHFKKGSMNDAPKIITFTLDLKRCEFLIPLTTDCDFTYLIRRVIISSSVVDKCTVIRARLHTSNMKVADEREVLLPGIRVTYCSGPPSSLNCHIDRLDIHLTADIINSWLHMYTTVAPQVLKLFETRTSPPANENGADQGPIQNNSTISRASVQWCGIKVSIMGETSEFVVGSGMGLVRYKTNSSATSVDEFTLSETSDKVWYARLPRVGCSLHDSWEHKVRLQTEIAEASRRASYGVKKGMHYADDEGYVQQPEKLQLGYRWGSASLALYAGNCDVDKLASQDERKVRTQPPGHRKSHSGERDRDRQSIPQLVVEPPPQPTPEASSEKVDILINNTALMVRAGFPEQLSELANTLSESVKDFQERIEKDRRRILEGEAAWKLRNKGRRWAKKTTDTVEKVRDPATFLSSTVGSFMVKNTSFTLPFGDRAYWTAKSIGTSGLDAFLSSTLDQSMTEADCLSSSSSPDIEYPECLNQLLAGVSGRFLPTQALQIHLGEASISTLVEQDESGLENPHPGPASPNRSHQTEERPKKAVILCKARDAHLYFTDGQPLPSSWMKDRGGRTVQAIDPRVCNWFKEFGPHFTYVLGGKGIFYPANSRFLMSMPQRSRCCIKNITIRSRARIWKECVTAAVTCDISGPEVRIAPNIVSCITDLSNDFTGVAVTRIYQEQQNEKSPLSKRVQKGKPCDRPPGEDDMQANSHSCSPTPTELDCKQQAFAIDCDFTCLVEPGTVIVTSDHALPATFQQHERRDSQKEKSVYPNSESQRVVFKLPTPRVDTRCTVKVPPETVESESSAGAGVVTQVVTCTIVAGLPTPPDKIEIHPTSVYFTNELSLWKRTWPATKADWKDSIESHVEGFHDAIRDGFGSQLSCKIPHLGNLTAHIKGDRDMFSYQEADDPSQQGANSGEVFFGHISLIDVLLPLPRSLIEENCCPDDCALSHTGPCLKCAKDFDSHLRNGIGHTCDDGTRGLWKIMAKPVVIPKTPTTPRAIKVDFFSPLTSPTSNDYNTGQGITVRPAHDPYFEKKVFILGRTYKDVEKEIKETLEIAPCWDIQLREWRDSAGDKKIILIEDLTDGEQYVIDVVGAQVYFSIRIKPVTIAATTAPISDCQALLEISTVDLALVRTPHGRGAAASITVSAQPMINPYVIRLAVKDKVHECICVSVSCFSAYIRPGSPQRLFIHISAADQQALRFIARAGHLKSFFVVYKLWKKKSDDALAELMKTIDVSQQEAVKQSQSEVCSKETRTDIKSTNANPATCQAKTGSSGSKVVIVRVDSILVDCDNFRTPASHGDRRDWQATDKMQLSLDDMIGIWSFRKGCPLGKPDFQNRSRNGSLDIVSAEAAIGKMAFESQGKISSDNNTKTADSLMLRTKRILNPEIFSDLVDNETALPPLVVMTAVLPALEIDLREMFKPLLNVKLHTKDKAKPVGWVSVKDGLKPVVPPESPLGGYKVDINVIMEGVEVNLRPLLFPKVNQVIMDLQKTKNIEEQSADRVLKGLKERSVRTGNRHLRATMRPNPPTPVAVSSPETLKQPLVEPMVTPRGIIVFKVNDISISLGNDTSPSIIKFKARAIRCSMAQSMKKVPQLYLWDVLEEQYRVKHNIGNGKQPITKETMTKNSQASMNEAIEMGGLPKNLLYVGRVDRMIREVTVTSWKVVRTTADHEALLLSGDKESLINLDTNQFLGNNIVQYKLWSHFPQAWKTTVKTSEIIAVRDWLNDFKREAAAGTQEGESLYNSLTDMSADSVVDDRVFLCGEKGFEFAPGIQVVGESVLPVNTLFGQLGIDINTVPAAVHSKLGDTLELILLSTYRLLAPSDVIERNQNVVSEMTSSSDNLTQAHCSHKEQQFKGEDHGSSSQQG